MNRRDFQHLSEVRLREAEALFAARRYDGAYYLAGYCVEFALKACLAKKTKKYDFPPNRRAIDDFYSHDLDRLLATSGLKDLMDALPKDDPIRLSWEVVKRWSEQSRYSKSSKQKARTLLDAIADPRIGVFGWLKSYW